MALLRIHPDGSTELIEGHATETGEAPNLELPEAEAPVQSELESPESRGTIDLDQTNSQWREPAARVLPVGSEMPAPSPAEPSVSEPARIAPPMGREPELHEPPADWPVAPAPEEVTALTDPQILAPIPVGSTNLFPSAPKPDDSEPTAVDSAPPTAPAAAPEPAPEPELEPTSVPESVSTPVAVPAVSPEGAPAVLGGLDAKKPAARLRGTEVVEIHARDRTPPPPPPAEPDLRQRLRNAKPVRRDSLKNMVPEAILFTVEAGHPRWSPPVVPPAALTPEVEAATPAPVPTAPVAAAAPSASYYPEPPLSGAHATPAFSATPPPMSQAVAPSAQPVPAAPPGPSTRVDTQEEDDFDEQEVQGGSPWKMLAIAASLIAVFGLAVYFMGDVNENAIVSSAEPEAMADAAEPVATEDEPAAPEPAAPEEEPVDDVALSGEETSEDGVEEGSDRVAGGEAVDAQPAEPLADTLTDLSPDASPEAAIETPSESVPEPRPLATRAAKPKTAAKPLPTRPVAKPTPKSPETTVSVSSRDVAKANQLYLKANQLLKQEKVALAIDTLKDSIELNPRNGVAYRSLGVSYMKLGQPRSAIAAYKKFVELSPTHHDADAVRQIIANYSTR